MTGLISLPPRRTIFRSRVRSPLRRKPVETEDAEKHAVFVRSAKVRFFRSSTGIRGDNALPGRFRSWSRIGFDRAKTRLELSWNAMKRGPEIDPVLFRRAAALIGYRHACGNAAPLGPA